MERCKCCGSLLAVLAFLMAATVWAADRPAASEGTPAILASLDAGKVTVLNDQAAMAVRGQGYQYVLVRTILNPLDFGPGLNWTTNILGYRYGAWGGYGWTNGGLLVGTENPADPMDMLFQTHDGDLNNAALIAGLQALPNTWNPFWGEVYIPAWTATGSNVPVDAKVWVSSISILGGKFFFGWRAMPYTEYSRREALTGMQLLGLIP
jgi:hypothetical protein